MQKKSLLRHEHGAFGYPVRRVFNATSDTQYRLLRREHAAAARAGQSKSVFVRTK